MKGRKLERNRANYQRQMLLPNIAVEKEARSGLKKELGARIPNKAVMISEAEL